MVHAGQFLNGGTLKIRKDTVDKFKHEDDPVYKALMSLAAQIDEDAEDLLKRNKSDSIQIIAGTMNGCAQRLRDKARDRMIEFYGTEI